MTAAPSIRPSWPANLPPMPEVDFSLFGQVEVVPLTRTQKTVSSFLARNWAQIPHVTHHDEADIGELEAHRKKLSAQAGAKISLVPCLVKAAARALMEFPRFNASLAQDGETLILKKFFHIGCAVETPGGLVVPVIRDCDKKSITEISSELTDKTARARGKGLPMSDMSGGCFTVSSLGSIGGTGFTPIINAPELAILGVARAVEKLKLLDGKLVSALMLPLSLSYDHRVINGADAARFLRCIADQLAEPAGLEKETP
jgi:pyruvate dehydrogenase E2 component (dihydrolipoamide acetyltransferase)